MSDSVTTGEVRASELSASVRSVDDRRWDQARYALAACWIVVLVIVPFLGEKTADWSDVRDLVSKGTVTEVRISHELPPDSTGFATVAVHWRHGPLDYVASVRQVRHDDSYDATNTDDVSAVLHSAPSDLLLEVQPGLRIHHDAHQSDPGVTTLGFHVPMVLALVPVVLVLLGLALLLVGPDPWRATPWAWFWWLWHPIGVAAYLVLAGPFPGLPSPRHPERRLTGGWSFLLMLFVTSLSFTVLGVTVDL